MTQLEARWYSLHLFLSDPLKTEAFLTNILAPCAQKLMQEKKITNWFFIRYWLGGPHLRFRFLTNDPALQSELINTFSSIIDNYKAERAVSREEYYQQHSFDGESLDPATLPWHPDGSVVIIDYEPEYQRYGGEKAIVPAEVLFCQSSNLAVALVKASSANLSLRSGIALPLMLTTVLAYSTDPQLLRGFFFGYASYWQQYSSQNQALAAKELANPTPDIKHVELIKTMLGGAKSNSASQPQTLWRKSVKTLISELHAINATGQVISPFDNTPLDKKQFEPAMLHILSSQIHMLNNRLAMSPSFELLFSLKIVKALDAILVNEEKENVNENPVFA
jgi:thiopeptide-type bacteriocin biosynthesis protein